MNQYSLCNRNPGYTIIETLVVIVVVGIVASISIPSMYDYVRDQRQDEAKVKLLEVLQRQEKFKATDAARQFTTDLTQLGYPADPVPSSNDPRFTIAASNCTVGPLAGNIGLCIRLVATPGGGDDSSWAIQSDDAELVCLTNCS